MTGTVACIGSFSPLSDDRTVYHGLTSRVEFTVNFGATGIVFSDDQRLTPKVLLVLEVPNALHAEPALPTELVYVTFTLEELTAHKVNFQ